MDVDCSHSRTSSNCNNNHSCAVSTLDQQVVDEHDDDYCVVAFYQFFVPLITWASSCPISDARDKTIDDDDDDKNGTLEYWSTIERAWRVDIESVLRSYQAYGMVRISIQEGMNGTICFPTEHLDNIRTFLHQQQYYHRRSIQSHHHELDETHISESSSPLKIRLSYYNTPPFHRLSIRIKKEIVTMGPIPQHWISDVDQQNDFASDNNASTAATCLVRPYSQPATGLNHIGIYVPPGPEWDELLYDPHCLVIDTRNEYEIQMGTFHNAVSPHINEFTEFPIWLHDTLEKQQQQESQPQYNKIAMFCTGGIRCEKATALCVQMLHKKSSSSLIRNNNKDDVAPVIPPVYHLEGGILAYLESNHQVATGSTATHTTSDTATCDQQNESNERNDTDTSMATPSYGDNFIGECFVFDQRVAVTYGLQPTQQYVSCHGCRRPVHVDITINPNEQYQKGICCPACYDENVHGTTNANGKKQRFIERQKQIDLAVQKLSQKPHLYDSKYTSITTGDNH